MTTITHLIRPLCKPTTRLALPITNLAHHAPRRAASTSSGRRQVTIASDDGRISWTDLSAREKAARTTQQSFNLLIILAGMAGTGVIGYYLYAEIFSTESKTAYFNRAVDRVKADARCTDVLGPGKQIKAFGEPTWNRWQRHRNIASSVETDRVGVEHLRMHFNVEGPLDKGVVRLHMTKRPGEREFEWRYLALQVKGQQTIYLENADEKPDKKNAPKMFGVRWW